MPIAAVRSLSAPPNCPAIIRTWPARVATASSRSAPVRPDGRTARALSIQATSCGPIGRRPVLRLSAPGSPFVAPQQPTAPAGEPRPPLAPDDRRGAERALEHGRDQLGL